MKLLALVLRASLAAFVLAALTGLLSGACAAGLMYLIADTVRTLAWTSHVGTFAAVAGGGLVASAASHLLLAHLHQALVFNLRTQVASRILETPLSRIELEGSPRLWATLTEDIHTVSTALSSLPHLVVNAAVLLGCLGYLCWLSPTLFGVTTLFLFAGVASYRLMTLPVWGFLSTSRELQDRLYQSFRALTEGIKELKLHRERRAAFFTSELAGTSAALRRSNFLTLAFSYVAASWGRFLFFALVGLVLFYVGPKVGATAGVITGYALTLLYIQSPLEVIMSWLPDFLRGLVSLRKMDSLALGGTDLTPSPTPRPTQATFARLELRGVTHSYRHEKDDRVFTLGPIDCTLVPGELVFIVGGNGSGKTTLGKVLTGLYPPETGRIFLNGAEVTEGARDDYRQTFSAVFSDFFLFDRFLGLPAAAEAGRINDYLERLQLSHKVRIEGERLSTTALSQGQRKRLALLTAYLEDRPVYLFDEWAADQDPSFKDVFYRVLLPELKARSKAVVVITHDDRYFDAADRIIRLESGKLRAAAVERQALTTAS